MALCYMCIVSLDQFTHYPPTFPTHRVSSFCANGPTFTFLFYSFLKSRFCIWVCIWHFASLLILVQESPILCGKHIKTKENKQNPWEGKSLLLKTHALWTQDPEALAGFNLHVFSLKKSFRGTRSHRSSFQTRKASNNSPQL